MTIISNFPKESNFVPKQFGPAFSWEGDNNIRLLDGTLKEQSLFIQKQLTDKNAEIILYSQGKRIGHCSAEIEKNSLIEIWDVVVDENYQTKGLASLMVKILLRELLFQQTTTRIKFRMITLFKPDEQELKLRNIGVGVIVYKLGMTCEYNIEPLIMQNNVIMIDCIPPFGLMPPAYKFTLDVFPYTLIALLMNREKEKPVNDYDVYIKFRTQFEIIIDWNKKHQLIFGNANYLLKEDGIDEFISRIAISKTESELFLSRIQPIK